MKYFIFSGFLTLAIMFFSCSQAEKNEKLSAQKADPSWIRPTAKGGITAAYLNYTNEQNVADTLISISSPVSPNIMIHESYSSDQGMKGMKEINEVILQSGEQLDLEPGGMHVMITDLTKPIQLGDTVMLVFNWKVAGLDTLHLKAGIAF